MEFAPKICSKYVGTVFFIRVVLSMCSFGDKHSDTWQLFEKGAKTGRFWVSAVGTAVGPVDEIHCFQNTVLHLGTTFPFVSDRL